MGNVRAKTEPQTFGELKKNSMYTHGEKIC
jgi:hypothetical protein